MESTSNEVRPPKVVSHSEWLLARKEHLAKEKEFTRLRDELSRHRRALPWEKVEKQYVFEGPNGKVAFAELFEKKSQLVIYHFMFGPGWKEGCPSCSYISDHFDGMTVHLANRDVSFAVVSRAPYPELTHSKSVWAGASNGSRPSAPTSTTTTTCHSSRSSRPLARSTTTTLKLLSPAKKVPASASLLSDAKGISSTLTQATARPRHSARRV